MRKRLFCAFAASVLASSFVLGAPHEARADATAEQRAAAQALFDAARKLIAEKRWAEACPKLQESQDLDPGLGTLLNLAECQAQIGKTASAWANFLEAAYQAKATNQAKREATARAHAAALEPRLSRLTILAVTNDASVQIQRDGKPVAPSVVGTPLPVDPGQHVITASASGKKPWSTTVIVGPDGHQATVSVPQLEEAEKTAPPPLPSPLRPPPPSGPEAPKLPLPPEEPPPSGPPPNLNTGKGPRAAGAVMLAAGLGGLAAATTLTILAVVEKNDSNSDGCSKTTNVCPNAPSPTTGNNPHQERTTARIYGDAATAAWIAGGVVGAAGVALLAAATGIKAKPTALAPSFSIGARGGSLGTTWSF